MFEIASETSRFVKESIVDFGVLLADNYDDKCYWEPVREIVWLCHVLNMNKHKLYIIEERIKGLEYFTDSLLFQLQYYQGGTGVCCWSSYLITKCAW